MAKDNTDFTSLHGRLCSKYGLCKSKAKRFSVKDGMLELFADKIKTDEWQPLVEAIKDSTDLKQISLQCQTYTKLNGNSNIRLKRGNLPAILDESVKNKLFKSLRQCLKSSTVLECLALKGINLQDSDLILLREGLANNQSLVRLSVEKCKLGNKGFHDICMGIKNARKLISINFSDCNLTWKAMNSLVDVIQNQDALRHAEMWKGSLRYRCPNLNEIGGLQEIILDENPGIGDMGSKILAEVLKDDLWIKVLSLQKCGITDDGAQLLLPILTYNVIGIEINLDGNPLQNIALANHFVPRMPKTTATCSSTTCQKQ